MFIIIYSLLYSLSSLNYLNISFISSYLKTTHNQFGFECNHDAGMCAFFLKQCIASYVNQNTPVFVAFLDASKACGCLLIKPFWCARKLFFGLVFVTKVYVKARVKLFFICCLHE